MRKNQIIKSVVAFLMMAFMLAPMVAGFIHLDQVDAYDYSTTQQIITSQTTTSSVAYGPSVFRWTSGHNPGTIARSGRHANEIITPSHQSGTGLNRFYVWCVQQKRAAPEETANAIQAVNGYYSGGLHKGLAAILENGYPITASIPMLNADGTTTSKSWSGEYARQITANAIRAFLANHNDAYMYSQMKTTVAGGYFEVNTTDCGTGANGAKESLYYLVALAESAVTGGYSDGKGGTSSSTGIKYTAWGPTLNIANHTVTKSGNNYTGTITMTHNNDVAVVSVSPSKGTVTNITRVNGSKTTCTYTVPVSSLNANGETVTFTITYKSAKLRVWRDGRLECYIAKYPTSNVQDCLIEPWPASSQAWPDSDEPQSTKTVSFKVTPETGTLVIKKESTNHAFTDNNTYYTMSGAKYKLMTGTGSSGTAVAITNISGGTYVSNGEFTVNSGAYSSSTSIATVTISNLAPGSYILVESAGNDTYDRNTNYKNFTITSGDTTTLQYSNTMVVRETPKTGSVSITKVSSNPSLTNGNSNYSLAGAVYTLTNTTLGTTYTLTTNASGYASKSELPFGSYTLVETTASTGYTKASGSYSFNLQGTTPTVSITSSNTNVLKETPITGTVNITKVSANPTLTTGNPDYSLAGAVYTLTNTDTNTTYTLTTDANGAASKSGLPLGAYTLVETTPSLGFQLSAGSYSFTIQNATAINITSAQTSILSENPIIASIPIEITKNSIGNGLASTQPLSGAIYKIYDQSDNSLVTTLTTDATGAASGSLPGPGSYYMVEDTAPTGYQLPAANVNRYDFTVANGTTSVSITSANTNILADMPATGAVEIIKIDSVTGSALNGAVYRIKKTTSSTWITLSATSGGSSYASDLEPGTYTIEELTAPTGYSLNIGSDTFTVVAGESTVLTGTAVSAIQSIPYQTVQHSDLLMDDPLISASVNIVKTGGGSPLSGAVLQIKQGNTVLDEWTTNGSTHTFSVAWDPNLTYTLHEVSAPSGYSVAADISFTINGSGEVVMNNVVQSNNTITMEDTLDIGGLRIYKTRVNTNPDTNPSLAGAVYAIKKVGDSTWTNLPATDANGVSSLGNLASGTYSIKEVSAPTGFYTNIEINTFTIVTGKETVLTYNGSAPSGVTLTSDQIIGNASCLAEREEKVDLIIIKDAANPTAASGLSLAGAVYSLYKADGTLVGTATTSEIAGYDYTTLANGQYIENSTDRGIGAALFTNLPGYGDYYIVETTAPTGFALPTPNRYDFTIYDDFECIADGEQNSNWYDLANSYIISSESLSITTDIGGQTGYLYIEDNPDYTPVQTNSVKPGGAVRDGGGALNHWGVNYTSFFAEQEIHEYYIEKVGMTLNLNNSGTTLLSTYTPLPGAVLQIKLGDTVVEQWTSTSTPHLIAASLTPNTNYTLHEVSAPSGYTAVDDFTFYVDSSYALHVNNPDANNGYLYNSSTIRVVDCPYIGVYIIKQSSVEGDTRSLAGAEFKIYDANTNALVTTITTVNYSSYVNIPGDCPFSPEYENQNVGYAHTSLAPGDYYMVETKAPAGFALPNPNRLNFHVGNYNDHYDNSPDHYYYCLGFWIVASSGEEAYTPNNNQPGGSVSSAQFLSPYPQYAPFLLENPAHYYIDKRAADMDNASQSGAVLQIKQGNTVIEQWTSNGTPHEIQALLQHNVTYTLHEASAPSGYYEAADINFYIGDDGKMYDGVAGGSGGYAGTTIYMDNYPLNDVVIIKQSSVAGDTRSMAGAQFAVYDADTNALVTTVTTVAGPYQNLPNEIDITGTYGYATFSLKPGDYYMVETVAPAGFQLASPNRVDFTIHQQLPAGITSSNITNYSQYITWFGTLDNSVSHGNSGEEYYTCYQRPFFIVSGTTTGMIVDDDYSFGFMDVHSVEPGEQVRGDGSSDIYYRFAYGMTTPFLSEEPVTDAYIEKLTGGGVALPGATLQIKQGNTVIESWTSTNSPHKITATLTPGVTYTLHEVSAPSGYGLALDINFTVDAAGNVLIGGQTQTNNSVKMYDYKSAQMPGSGSEDAIVLSCIGAVILLAGIAIMIVPRRRKRTQAD